jgi:hypothetical protein
MDFYTKKNFLYGLSELFCEKQYMRGLWEFMEFMGVYGGLYGGKGYGGRLGVNGGVLQIT